MRGLAQKIRTVTKVDTEIYLWPPCVHRAYPTHTPTLNGQMHDPTPAPGMEYGKATVLKASKTEEVSDSLFMVSSPGPASGLLP